MKGIDSSPAAINLSSKSDSSFLSSFNERVTDYIEFVAIEFVAGFIALDPKLTWEVGTDLIEL